MAYSGNFYNLLPGKIQDDQWKIPFALAVGLHLFVLMLSFLPPSLFYSPPKLPEIITINLFNTEELRPKKVVPPKRQPKKEQAQKTPPPPAKKPVTSIPQEILPPPPAAAPHKVVSLTPKRVKKKVPPPLEKPKKKTAEDDLLKELARIKAKINKKLEEQKAIHDLAELRESLHITQPETKPAPEPAPPSESTTESGSQTDQASAPSSGSTELMDMALKRYYIAVSRRIHNHWILPEIQNWDESLEALLVVIVRHDGTITQSYFEKRSDNAYFNQFVEKTIKEAAPLPQFPADLKKTNLEIGLRFRPSGLF